MVEATGLKGLTLRSPSISSTVISGGIHRQLGDFINRILIFVESRLKCQNKEVRLTTTLVVKEKQIHGAFTLRPQ
jgi:hypothetical protein